MIGDAQGDVLAWQLMGLSVQCTFGYQELLPGTLERYRFVHSEPTMVSEDGRRSQVACFGRRRRTWSRRKPARWIPHLILVGLVSLED